MIWQDYYLCNFDYRGSRHELQHVPFAVVGHECKRCVPFAASQERPALSVQDPIGPLHLHIRSRVQTPWADIVADVHVVYRKGVDSRGHNPPPEDCFRKRNRRTR